MCIHLNITASIARPMNAPKMVKGQYSLTLNQVTHVKGSKGSGEILQSWLFPRNTTHQQVRTFFHLITDSMWSAMYPEERLLREYLDFVYADTSRYPKSIRVPQRLIQKMREDKKLQPIMDKAAKQSARQLSNRYRHGVRTNQEA